MCETRAFGVVASTEAEAELQAELQDSIPPPVHPSMEENDEEEVEEGKDEGLTLLEVLDGVSPAKDELMYATAHAQHAAEQARAAPAGASRADAAPASVPAAALPPLAARDLPGHGRGSRAKSKKQSAVLPSPATSARPSVSSLTSHVDSSSEPPPTMLPSPFLSRLQLPSSSPDATIPVEHAGASLVPMLALPLSLGHVWDVPVKESDSSHAESSRSDSSGARASADVSGDGDGDDDDASNGNACGKCVSCLESRFGGQGKVRKACSTIFGHPKGPSDARGSKRSKAMSMERETQALLFDVVSSKLVGALPDGRASRRAKATTAAAAERAHEQLFPTVSLTDLFCYDTLPLQLPQPHEQLRGGTSGPSVVLEKKAARKVIKTSAADVMDKEAAKEAKATGKVRGKAAIKTAKADQAIAAIAVEAVEAAEAVGEQLDAKASIDARPHLATPCVSQASHGSAESHIRGTPSQRAFPDRVDNVLPRIAEPPLPSPVTPSQVNTPSSMTPMPSLEPLAPLARLPWAPPPMRSTDLLRLFEEESTPSALSACTGCTSVSTSTMLPFSSPPLGAAGSAVEVFAEAVTRAVWCSDWAVSAAAVGSPGSRAAVATAARDACAISPLFSEALGLSPALSEILRHGDVLEDAATFQQLEAAVAARLLERELHGPRPSTLSAQRNLEVELHGLLPSAEDVEALALEAERAEDGNEDDDDEMDRSGETPAREAASYELKGRPLPKHNQAEKKRERREKSRASNKAQRSLENAPLPLPAVPLGEPLTGTLEAAAVAKPLELPPLPKAARKSHTLLAPQLPCPKCAKPFDHHNNVTARNRHITSCLLSEQPPKRHKKGTALEAVLTTALEVKEEATTASLRAHVEALMDGEAEQETDEAGPAADAASIPIGVLECDADASELIGAAKSDGANAGGGEAVGTSEDEDGIEDEDEDKEGEGEDARIADEEDGEGQEHAKEHASSWLDSEEREESSWGRSWGENESRERARREGERGLQ